jgi:hypothetical protein
MQFAFSFANCAIVDDDLVKQCQPVMHDVTLSLARAGRYAYSIRVGGPKPTLWWLLVGGW